MCEMMVREKLGVFDYQPGNSQGLLIHVLDMNPVSRAFSFVVRKFSCNHACTSFSQVMVKLKLMKQTPTHKNKRLRS